MKRVIVLLFAIVAISLSASQNEASNALKKRNNILVVYFSMPETRKAKNMTRNEENSVVVIDGEVLGNTEYVAKVIQEHTGGDIFRIEARKPYPRKHKALVDLAYNEKNQNARPALKSKVLNIDDYETIFVGYPNWWSDMPMILYTFFDEHDLSGKKIVPFNSHGGSGLSDTINTIAKLEPEASVERNAYSVSRDVVDRAKPEIINWLKEIGF